MKKTGLFLIGLTMSLTVSAQEQKDSFSSFLQDELDNFDNFISSANQEFINFMRDPWKEFEAEKPKVKEVKPKPVKPIVYDRQHTPVKKDAVCLTIEEILDLTSKEGKQKASTKVKDVEDIVFDKPAVIVKKKKKPTVIVIEEKIDDEPTLVPEQDVPAIEPTPTVKDTPQQEKPVVKQDNPVSHPIAKPEPEPVRKPDLKPAQKPESKPAPNTPLYTQTEGREQISFGSQTFYLPKELKGKCRLSGVKEKHIADACEQLYASDYKPLLKECKQIASDLCLNDWGVYKLVSCITDTYAGMENERTLLQFFLLSEMGYKVKIARKSDEDKLLLFMATNCTIYQHPYLNLNGDTYYIFNQSKPCLFYMCEKNAPNAHKELNMNIRQAPRFAGGAVSSTHRAKGNDANVTVSVPKALSDFYKSYPQCDFNVYFNAAVNADVANALISSLSTRIQGKNEAEAANILINFVQTGFEYETDDKQFGYEKPFFVEELFFYPYSDCEDRSILYSYLVRHLLGLDVVLLKYPNHLATAVCFNENVEGDHVMVGGKKYIVCDPTYINASIGMAMPQFKNVSAKVLKY